MQYGSLRFSEADQQYVSACIGRTPQGVIGVAARNNAGQPTVIINLPLMRVHEKWLPFPTLYWLVDPALSARISDIERQGGVRNIETIIKQSAELSQAHRTDNTFYAMARWAVLNEKEKQTAAELGLQDVLETTGIGGVGNYDGIKCLHAQYAFHLARNEVGTTAGKLMRKHYGI